MLEKILKLINHNRGVATALLVIAGSLIYGCSPVRTASPISGAIVSGAQLSQEYNAAQRLLQQDYDSNEAQIRELMRVNGRIVQDSEALDEDTDAAFEDLNRQVAERKSFLDLGIGALETAIPGAGAALGGIMPLLTASLLGGAVYDNRRKNRVIIRQKNGASS